MDPTISVFDKWLSMTRPGQEYPGIGLPGLGSDYAPFIHNAGISVIDVGFRSTRGFYSGKSFKNGLRFSKKFDNFEIFNKILGLLRYFEKFEISKKFLDC